MADSTLADATLDELREALAAELPAQAAFDGWTPAALDAAAQALGIDADVARVAMPGGAVQMIEAWFAWVDAEMVRRMPPERVGNMKIRDRITRLVETRLEIVAPHKEALRRAAAILAMPQNAPLAVKLGWRAADRMWRVAGDTATDYNHYTKRMTLSAVYASTVTVFLGDESEDWAETRAFLGRRIENVMQFEKAKARLLKSPQERLSLSRFIGRLRYPVQ